jgi:hypothetical protein
MPRLIFLNMSFLVVAGIGFARADMCELEMNQMIVEVLGGVGLLTLVCIVVGGISWWFFNPEEGIMIPAMSTAFISFVSVIFWFAIIGNSAFGYFRVAALILSLIGFAFIAAKMATGLQTIEYKMKWSVIPFAITALAFGSPLHLPAYKWAPCCVGIILLAAYRACLRYITYENNGSSAALPISVASDDGEPSPLDYMSSRGR